MPQLFARPTPPTGPQQPLPTEAPNRPIGQDWLSDAVDVILGGLGIENPLNPSASKAVQIGGMVGAALPIAGAVKAMRPASQIADMTQALTATEAPRGIRAYHGSPHDFDKFSMSKIGTGEGAQAYGHGLYFAENEKIAKGYRDALATAKDFPKLSPGAQEWMGAHGDKTTALKNLRATMAEDWDGPQEHYARIARELEAYQPNKGAMYEVAIKADPEHFLDWDKPLSEQSEKVRQALKIEADSFRPARLGNGQYGVTRVGPDGSGKIVVGIQADTPEAAMSQMTGGKAYQLNASRWDAKSKADAANELKQAGIPGIKYLDGGSRSAGEGSRNYVVFDDNIVDILKKYGIVLPVAGAAAASAKQ